MQLIPNRVLNTREGRSEGGEQMRDYELTVEVLEARIAPVSYSLGGQ